MANKPILTPSGQTVEISRRYKLNTPRNCEMATVATVQYDRFKVTTEVFHDGPTITNYYVYGVELTAKGEPDKRKEKRWHQVFPSFDGIQEIVDILEEGDG